ncbi:phosphinothricin acetyltransferase [Aliiroseovarius halocynthiae]|uniref:N-acetyltransferase n=1 Tax=Aliiroseovarius halocynthiae TaxID=985055 RepID=A0A545SME2_9RHOB|nr:GNAT family N-acetyltransferase [Aliiroseovarius halocynthiae]TQV66124.1 N-acetyltransferase [Aliiroseovarius halocynthiae]SMR83222.1 phosphinothricin acetyltransferase [Aliiroseovarius halocynthiae]
MIIRAATILDARAIQALWNLAIRETLITFNSIEKSREDVEQAIESSKAMLVAEVGGTVIGYASFDQFRGGAGYARTAEHSIMLSPRARGRGAGRALMQRIEDEARTQGFHSMIAGVSGSNPLGEPFHAAIGYVTVGTIPQAGRKFDQWHDLVLMQKIL